MRRTARLPADVWGRCGSTLALVMVDAALFLFCDTGLMTDRLRSLILERPGYRNRSIMTEMISQHTLQPGYRAWSR